MSFELSFLLLVLSLGICGSSVAYLVIPQIIRRASSWGILDLPDERKPHLIPTPRLGGLSIAPAFWLGCSVTLLLANVTSSLTLSRDLPLFTHSLTGLLIGGFGIFILGGIDDCKRLNAIHKLSFQILVAGVTVFFLPIPSMIFGFPLHPALVGSLMFLWLILIPNSVNLLDGVDGLTSALSVAFLAAVSSLAIFSGEYGWLFVLVPCLTATATFLKFNWSPAKIFLGDSGSLLLGFIIAYLSLLFAIDGGSAHRAWNPLISILLTSVWLLDTFLAIFRRYIAKYPSLRIFLRSRILYLGLQGSAIANICRPDRKHLHHRLMDLGLSSKRIAILISCLTAVSMGSAVGIWHSQAFGTMNGFWSTSLFFISISFAAYFFTGIWLFQRTRQLGLTRPADGALSGAASFGDQQQTAA